MIHVLIFYNWKYPFYFNTLLQDELKRICNELEYLKEQNIKLGVNTHVVTKIIAMQDAAKFGNNRKSPDKSNGKSETLVNSSRSNSKKVNRLVDKIIEEDKTDIETNIILNDLNGNHNNSKDHSEVFNINNNVTSIKGTIKETGKDNHVKTKVDANHKSSPSSDKCSRKRSRSKCKCDSKECSCSQSGDDDASPRQLKSGHSRTRAIVINLDDKNRFTEEVTV